MNYVHPPNKQLYYEQVWALVRQVSYGKVANVAVDLFCDPTSAVKVASAESQGGVGSSATPVSDEQAVGRASKKSVFENILASEKLPWRIPELVERGFEIRICLTSTSATPEFGQFKQKVGHGHRRECRVARILLGQDGGGQRGCISLGRTHPRLAHGFRVDRGQHA